SLRFVTLCPSLSSTLFPYTTLFRSLSSPPGESTPLPHAGREDAAAVLDAVRGRARVKRHPKKTQHKRPGPQNRHPARDVRPASRSEEHTSELQSRGHLVCRLLLEKK